MSGGWGNVHSGCALFESECTDPGSHSVNLIDSFGDGWNGATMSISTCDGTPVATDLTLYAGSSHTAVVCLPAGVG